MSRTNKGAMAIPCSSTYLPASEAAVWVSGEWHSQSFFFFIPHSFFVNRRMGTRRALPNISKWRELWQDEDAAFCGSWDFQVKRREQRVKKDHQHHPSREREERESWTKKQLRGNLSQKRWILSLCVSSPITDSGQEDLSACQRVFDETNHCPRSLICVERSQWWEGEESWGILRRVKKSLVILASARREISFRQKVIPPPSQSNLEIEQDEDEESH